MTEPSPDHITEPSTITQLLEQWSGGDRNALDKLLPLVYHELRRIARRHMRFERAGHTLQTTALVNEAYIRLVDYRRMRWQDRAHFFAVAAQLMRRILVDHARGRQRGKRGGEMTRVPLAETMSLSYQQSAEMLTLDEALTKLESIDGRKSKVVELRFFAGMTNDEIGAVLGIAPNTVIRDWNVAQAWLRREISRTQ